MLVRGAQNKGLKRASCWIGHRRVTALRGDMLYDVEHVLTHVLERVHAARLPLYRCGERSDDLHSVVRCWPDWGRERSW